MKLTEELNELSSALMQHLTKSKNNLKDIIDECGDVKFRFDILIKTLNIEKKVKKRVSFKAKNALENVKNKKYLHKV